jgi:hypothetical protein
MSKYWDGLVLVYEPTAMKTKITSKLLCKTQFSDNEQTMQLGQFYPIYENCKNTSRPVGGLILL